ncbi:MAG: methylaspartate mutase [Armatimonadia bacterium]|nr:methylaspartate mutase [Armatimonadia bacterium]
MSEPRSILATDCGSTTTKAILIEKDESGYRLAVRGEAPTTVEAPFEDVTRGVLNAVQEVEELSGRTILDENERIIKPEGDGRRGIDLYVSTSSAGGGLQMMVSGVVKQMTAESAQRAALGAGAIVMDALAHNDGRLPHERIARIRSLRPDMILMSGGTDGGTVTHVAEMAEIIAAADPRPRLGGGYNLPIIFAGNVEARDLVSEQLDKKSELHIVENIRPTMDEENLDPARDMVHELFMEHVMQQAPGYNKLSTWTDAPIMPTPAAVGAMTETVAHREEIQVVGVDIGGATTDVFSVFEGETEDEDEEPELVFNRTVSANLGMSYSVSNVLVEAGVDNVLRWTPLDIDAAGLGNRIKNKMIRPTTIPQTLESLMVEQAIAREALRLAFEQHKQLATGLKGIQQHRTIDQAFDQTLSGQTLVDLMDLDLIIGSGGVLSHAPRRQQSMLMMIDAFVPEGITQLAVDSIFMMPQLGVLAELHPEAAMQVFWRDCLIPLGNCIAPVPAKARPGDVLAQVTLAGKTHEVIAGEMLLIPSTGQEKTEVTVEPARGVDVGEGRGQTVTRTIRDDGVVGTVLDGRGRPLDLPEDPAERRELLWKWIRALDIYPEE